MHVRCPVEGCPYWIAWGGYLDPMIRAFKSHVRKEHSQLGGFYLRTDGGLVDTAFGDAIAAAFEADPIGERP